MRSRLKSTRLLGLQPRALGTLLRSLGRNGLVLHTRLRSCRGLEPPARLSLLVRSSGGRSGCRVAVLRSLAGVPACSTSDSNSSN